MKILNLFVVMLFVSIPFMVFAQDSGIKVELFDETSDQFELLNGRPIFAIDNFLPGETTIEKIRVHNLSEQNQTIGLKVVDFDGGCVEDHCLADEFILTIGETGNASLYSGSLQDFYEAGDIPLSEVGTGDNASYNLYVYFKEGTMTEFQGRSISFNLQIGFFTRETISGEVNQGGDGGSVYIPPIVGAVNILNTSGPVILSPTSVKMSCETDASSYCRIVYDTVPHSILSNPPNYGYLFSTPPTTNKITVHDIDISDLEVSTTYYYRFICWASPARVSKEYSFRVLRKENEETNDNHLLAQANIPTQQGTNFKGDLFVDYTDEDIKSTSTQEEIPQTADDVLMASISGFFSNKILIFIIILILLILLLIFVHYQKKKLDRQNKRV